MQYGITITTGDPRWIAEMAARAEAVGWDGVFYWDVIDLDALEEIHDPWVVLAAMAVRTSRVRIGAMITPLPRRRPWKLAREAASVDHLSGGRLVLPVGIGDPAGFGRVGEEPDRQVRAAMLDEGLEVLTGLWSGRPFEYSGTHYRVGEMTFRPPPVQRPRIPIWVVGIWPKARSMARALRYDGLVPIVLDTDGRHGTLTVEHVRAIAAHVAVGRPAGNPYEIVVEGVSVGPSGRVEADRVRPWIDAGATWWIETDWTTRDALAARIDAGPPAG